MRELAQLARLKMRTTANTIRGLRHQSKFKIAVLAVFGLAFWTLLFLLFYWGFRFIHRQVEDPYFQRYVDDYLLALYFFSLFLMLGFSTGLISQASLFRAKETEFLLVSPFSISSIFTYKFVESLSFSSWVVILLGTPVLMAYGLEIGAPWVFYIVVPLAFLPFVVIPAALGTIVVLGLVQALVHHRRTVAWAFGLAFGAILVWLAIEVAAVGREKEVPVFTHVWVMGVFGKIGFTQYPLLPTYWMKEVVIRMGHGSLDGVGLYAGLLAANALFLYSASERLASWRLRDAASAASAGGGRTIARSGSLADRAIHHAFAFLPARTRLYLEKDVKSFLRDPIQRYQFLILVGLLFLYIVNLRTFSYDQRNPFWRNLIAFLNLGATSLTMTTFASRFVFPLLSLEGRRFWILGILPVERREILAGKFVYAVTCTLVMSETLILLSCYMLRVPLQVAALHAFTVGAISIGVSGLAVGLGALYPNFRVDDPSKIVSGFGGTLNLVLSLGFILVVIACQAVPCHFVLAQSEPATSFAGPALGSHEDPLAEAYGSWIYLSGSVGLALSVAAAWIPMRLGLAHFERLEF